MTKVQIKSEKLTPLRGIFFNYLAICLNAFICTLLNTRFEMFFVFFSKKLHFTMLPLQVRCKSVVSPFLYWDKKQRHDGGK